MRRWMIALILIWPGAALAVNTSRWVHTSEADFKKGTFRNTVATNLGDVKLSRAINTLIEQNPRVSAVYCLAEAADGTVFAGTGPHGVVLRIRDGNVSELLHDDHVTNIFCLLIDETGGLLIGTGGEKGRILRIANPNDQRAQQPQPQEIFSDGGVQYVWAMRRTPDGNVYAATGPSGQVHEIKPDGSKSILLDSDENNVLSLLSDGKDTLYAGTDPNGLVYRINRKTKEVFVLFDAPETEISALALDSKGNLYAGTAEAREQPTPLPADEAAGATEKTGRPEGAAPTPIPSKPPEAPKPGPIPHPNPGEPTPIPKSAYMIDGWAELIRQALDEREGEPEPPNPTPPPGPGPKPPFPKPGPKPANAPANPNQPAQPPAPQPIDFGQPKPEGNAIYRIDPEGFVRETFRQNVMVLSMIERDGVLLVGTGSEGLIYQLDPAAQETVVLAKVDPKQVLAMLAARDGRILLGLANVGGVAAMSAGFAREGSFTSAVLDATQVSRFGKIHLQGSLPEGTKLSIATRSGNVQDPQNTGWSPWSDEASATSFVQVQSPPARFFQYRLTMSTDARTTPSVDEVDVAYQMPNLAPVVKSVKLGGNANIAAAAAGADAPNGAKATPRNTTETITWEAEDPNSDALTYSIYFRSGSKAPWILLKDKLSEIRYEWETRSVADGRYEIKVVASDAAGNVQGQGRAGSRVSDPIVVDNTAPNIGDINSEVKADSAQIRARVIDRGSTVASLEYSADSAADWQAVLPSDNIFDGPEESVDFTVSKLTPGAHQITLRAADAKGNYAYQTVMVTTERPANQ